MKDGIHPDYHFINVVMTDGTTYQTPPPTARRARP
jgi:ribosomal protein L31